MIPNSSRRKTLIFRIGSGSGFYSEYNNMIFAIAYTEINNINFKLFSKNANFSIENGWTDYFLPFCDEVEDDFHSTYNRRLKFPSTARMLFKKYAKGKQIPEWVYDKYKFYMIKQYLLSPYYKNKYKFNYFTFDLWNNFKELDPYYHSDVLNKKIKSDNYEGDLKGLFQRVIRSTYRFNEKVSLDITKVTSDVKIPHDDYIGLHIRAGDKILENKLFDIEDYFEIVRIKATGFKNIFLMTDDYRIYEKCKLKYPDYDFYTTCSENEMGYDNVKFNSQNNEQKYLDMVKLLASIELLNNSKVFIGVYNSNPGQFLYLRRNDCTYFVDKPTN